MVVAEDVVLWWNANPVRRRVRRRSRKEIVDTGGDSARGDLEMTNTVAAFRRPDSPSEGLGRGVLRRDIQWGVRLHRGVPEGLQLAHRKHISLHIRQLCRRLGRIGQQL